MIDCTKMKSGYYLLMCLLLFGTVSLCCQSSFVYHPEKNILMNPDDRGMGYEAVSIATKDKVKLAGWWIPAKQELAVLLFCHGNAGNISHRIDSIDIFHRLGLSVLIFDYRGFGTSEGSPSEAGTYRDAEAAWDYLVKERNIKPDKIIVFGRSLGGAIASRLAWKQKPRLLIVESSFISMKEIAKHHFPGFIVSLVLSYKYDTAHYIQQIDCPAIVIHSRDDTVIPFYHGISLYEKVGGRKDFVEIRGSHNEGFMISRKYYTRELKRLLKKYLGR